MKRVTGIGGVFFKAKDPVALRKWYRKHLGIEVQEWGGAVFDRNDASDTLSSKAIAWRVAAQNDESFAPSHAPFMINYLVENLTALLATLRQEGCSVIGEFDEGEQGKFGWILDPEGNKIELWEPATKKIDN